MNTLSIVEFPLKKDGILKKTHVAVWAIDRHVFRARSDVFSSEVGLNSLVLMNESDLPENMMKFNVWLYTRAIVNHTLEVSLSLLDDKNRQCYAVEKRLSNSTSETSKVCATVDFSIIPRPPPKFFHDGALRIQCSICVDMTESVSSGLKTSKEDFNKLEAQLQKHLENIEKAGALTKKDVFTWAISESTMKTKEVEVRSDTFPFASSEFCFSKLNTLNEHFVVCLNRKTPIFFQRNIQMTLAVLDNRGIIHYAKEEVTQGSSKVFLNYGKVFEDRGMFLDKGELKIYCSLQIDNSSKISDIASKAGGSSETSRLTTVSSPTENAADVETYSSDLSRAIELTPSPGNKLFSKSVGNPAQKLVAENSILISSKAEDKSEIEKELNEMLQLLHEARVDTVVIVYKKRTGTC